MFYRKSLSPDSTSAWSSMEVVGLNPVSPYPDMYTYPSLAFVKNDIRIVARYIAPGNVYRLVSVSRDSATGKLTKHQTIVDPGKRYYAHYYHKVSVDPWGRLFLNYSYYTDALFSDQIGIFKNSFPTVPLEPRDPTCVPTVSTAPSGTAKYCWYITTEVNSSVWMASSPSSPFRLTETQQFYDFSP